MKRNYRNVPVKDVASEELLFELIKRGMLQNAPIKTQFTMPHKTVSVRIGNNHAGEIIIDVESLKELDRFVAMYNNLSL